MVKKIRYPHQNQSISQSKTGIYSNLTDQCTKSCNEVISSIADLELCLRNPVNVEKKNGKIPTYDRIFKLLRIHFFLFIPMQARQNLFYCNSTVHSLVIAMKQNAPMEITVWFSARKSPFQVVFQSQQK